MKGKIGLSESDERTLTAILDVFAEILDIFPSCPNQLFDSQLSPLQEGGFEVLEALPILVQPLIDIRKLVLRRTFH